MKPSIKIFVDKEREAALHFIRSSEMSSIVDSIGSHSSVLERDSDFSRFYKWWNGIRRKISDGCAAKRIKVEETVKMAFFAANA